VLSLEEAFPDQGGSMRESPVVRGVSIGLLVGAFGCTEPSQPDDAPVVVVGPEASAHLGYTRTDLGSLDGREWHRYSTCREGVADVPLVRRAAASEGGTS
jgi:hypothetical protein